MKKSTRNLKNHLWRHLCAVKDFQRFNFFTGTFKRFCQKFPRFPQISKNRLNSMAIKAANRQEVVCFVSLFIILLEAMLSWDLSVKFTIHLNGFNWVIQLFEYEQLSTLTK